MMAWSGLLKDTGLGGNMWRKREIVNQMKYYEMKTDCDTMLMALLGSKQLVKNWWIGENLHFNMKTPLEVFNAGDVGQQNVFNYLAEHCNGGYH